jgi:DNA-binding GntR family transcriptional regulator
MAIPRLTGDDIEEMRRLCGQMRKLAAPVQRREYLNLNRKSSQIP